MMHKKNKIEKIEKAKMKIILKLPFLVHILEKTPIEESKEVPTFATDGLTIFYNPEFLERIGEGEVAFSIAHESFHILLEHLERKKERNPLLWNIVTDLFINESLKEIFNPKEEFLREIVTLRNREIAKLFRNINNPLSYTPEELYELLEKETMNEPNESLKDLKKYQDVMPKQNDSFGNKKTLPKEVIHRTLQDMRKKLPEGKRRGVLSYIDGFIKILATGDKPDYTNILKRYLSGIKEEWSTSSLNKKKYILIKNRMNKKVIYPYKTKQVSRGSLFLLIAIDVSESMDPEKIEKEVMKIKKLLKEFRNYKIHILFHDVFVLKEIILTPKDKNKPLEVPLGGGTSHEEVLKKMKEISLNIRKKERNPKIISLVFSDFQTDLTIEDIKRNLRAFSDYYILVDEDGKIL